MDGNGRWAKERGLPRIAGHRAGVKAVEEAMEGCRDLGVKILTLYTFSTENWKRPKEEVDALFGMLGDYLDREAKKLHESGIRFTTIGRIGELPGNVRDKIREVEKLTASNTNLTLNLALNYGGRTEIVDALRMAARDVKDGLLSIDAIDERAVSDRLYTKGMSDPDLMIRTSGEMRISNFLLWQLSYSEIFVLKKYWPDFTREDLKKVVADFQLRNRRYGG